MEYIWYWYSFWCCWYPNRRRWFITSWNTWGAVEAALYILVFTVSFLQSPHSNCFL